MEIFPTALMGFSLSELPVTQIKRETLPFQPLLCSFLAAGACTSIAKK